MNRLTFAIVFFIVCCININTYAVDYWGFVNKIGIGLKCDTLFSNKFVNSNVNFYVNNDSSLSIVDRISINNNLLKKIKLKKGNSSIDIDDLSDFEIYGNIEHFYYSKSNYFYIPLVLPNCHGRSCRYYSCVLVKVDNYGRINAFYFGNDEREFDFYFRALNKHLVFIDYKVKSNLVLMNDEDDYLYRISLLEFNPNINNWHRMLSKNGKDVYMDFTSRNHFDKGHIIITSQNGIIWNKGRVIVNIK